MRPDEQHGQDSGLIRWEGEGGAVPPEPRDPPHGPDLDGLDDPEPAESERFSVSSQDGWTDRIGNL